MSNSIQGLDSASGQIRPADQLGTLLESAAAANIKTSDAFTVERSNLNVIADGKYAFSFSYMYEDPVNVGKKILGPASANFRFTLQAPDLTRPVTNLAVTPGLLSYGVRWDDIDKSIAANKWFIDAQIYESLTGAFTGEEYLVWNGTGNSATILVSNTNNRWIRVDTRDQDYHKKSVISGPFKATDPITVDTVGPANVTSVTTTSGIDTSGYLGFNAFANVSWPAVVGGGIRGYRIRFSNDNGVAYSYVDSPGTGTTYKLAGLAIGSTYQIAVATYDEYNNTSSNYISAPNVTVVGTPSVSNYITGGPFEFGVGVGGVSTNKGLYFDSSNYWYVNATNSARLKVGKTTSNFLEWDGATFTVDGNITARAGTFSGNIFMSTDGASIYNGTIDTSGNLTGNGFALNSTGLKVANGSNSVTISAAAGSITANAGSIAGWNLSGTTLSKNNVILDSTGQIQLGSSANASVYLKSSGDFVMWAGNNTPDANAKFRVGSDGTLYATNATITGNITANSIAFGATYNGTSMTTIASGSASGSSALQPNGTLTGNVSGTVNGVAASTISASAANANSAVQPGNGITVDATTKRINAIKASSGLPISSGGTLPVFMDHTGLYMKNALGQDSIFLDAASGSAVFRGTIFATNGEFNGVVKVASGTKTTTIGSNATISLVDTSTGWQSDGAITIQSGDKFSTFSSQSVFIGNNTTGMFTNGALGGYGATDLVIVGNNINLGSIGGTGIIAANVPFNASIHTISSGNRTSDPSLSSDSAMLNPNGSIVARRGVGIPMFVGRYGSSGTVEAIRFVYSSNFNNMSDAGGINISTGTPSFRAPSDYRLKKNIEYYSGGLEKINMAKVRTFVMKSDEEENTQIGFVAHEFSEAFPEFVQGQKDGVDQDGNPEYQSIMTTNLIPHIVSAIQEISSSLSEIKQRLDALEG